MKNLRITISGKVYKTGLRYYAKQMAEGLGITGSVAYTPNHAVQIEASGTEPALTSFIEFCRLGCIGSQVHEISIVEFAGTPFPSFEIIQDKIENSIITYK